MVARGPVPWTLGRERVGRDEGVRGDDAAGECPAWKCEGTGGEGLRSEEEGFAGG